MTPVRIRYHRLWAPAALLLAVINIVLFASMGGLIQLALATMFLVVGILYAVRPVLVIDDEAVVAKSLIGITFKRIPHGSFENLQVTKQSIVLGPENRRQRLTLSRWMVSGGDVQRLADAVRDAREAATTT